jgi:hypothetical protein
MIRRHFSAPGHWMRTRILRFAPAEFAPGATRVAYE